MLLWYAPVSHLPGYKDQGAASAGIALEDGILVDLQWLSLESIHLQINGASHVAVTNSSFQYNLNANSQGGGLSAAGGTLSIVSSSFVGNRASLGGGVYVTSGNATFDDVTFMDNYAGSTGGGAYTLNAALELSNSTFRGNIAGNVQARIPSCL